MDPDRVQRYLAKFEKFEYFYNQFSKWLDQHPIDSIDPEKDAHWLYAIVHVFQNISELISDLVAMILKDLGKTIMIIIPTIKLSINFLLFLKNLGIV
ncbi:MAG: hypothetical protein DRO88_05120 [Promethearchaeia archaeon]|nr:MAG: hypothetical protein DRO88_05120 [Candidatus Lokiarchaeia archaeon]